MIKKTKIIIEVIVAVLLVISLSGYIYFDYFAGKSIYNDEKAGIIKQIVTLDFTKKNGEISEETVNKYEKKFLAASEIFLKNPYSSESFWPLIEIAQIKELIGDYQGDEQALLWAEELEPQSYVVQGNLGNLYFRYYQNFAKAEEHYLKAVASDDKGIIPYYLELHEIYQHFYKQETSLAEEILKQGLNKFTDETSLMAVLADYCQKSGRIQEAKDHYRKILEINPESQAAKQGLKNLE